MKHSIKLSQLFPYLWIAAGVVILLAYPILGGKSLFWGTPALQFIPWQVYAFEKVLNGQMPFFNDLVGLNAPLIANYQLAFFYPLNWLLLLFFMVGGTPLLAWAYNLLLVVHLIAAGTGMAKLIKQWGGDKVGMTIGGLAFCLSGYWVTRLGFISIIWSGAWLAWEMYYANELLRSEQKTALRPAFLKLTFCFAMQLLAGHAQTSWYSIALVSLWVLVRTLASGEIRRHWRKMVLFCLAGGLGAGLAGLQLLPTAEYLLQSQRAGSVEYLKALSYSFWPWHLLNFITPNLFGSPANGDYWGYLSYWEDAVYLGVFPLISALLTLPFVIKRDQDETTAGKQKWLLFLFGWVVMALTFILALGYNIPIYPFLYHYVPTFSMFNAPSRLMVIIVFMLSWFAGLGITDWQHPVGKTKKWLKRLLIVGFAFSIGALVAKELVPQIKATVFAPVILFGLLFSTTCILFLLKPKSLSQDTISSWELITSLFVLVDVLAAGIFFTPYVDMTYYQNTNIVLAEQQNYGRVFLDQQDEYALKFKKFLRFDDFSTPGDWEKMRASMLPNINMFDGIHSASNFDPLLLGRYQTWLDRFDKANNDQKKQMLKLMDVDVYLKTLLKSESGVVSLPQEKGSLANWSGCAQVAGDEQSALEDTINPSRDGLLTVELQIGQTINDPICGESSGTVTSTFLSAERAVVKVNTPAAGWVWLSYLYYPGWEVTIDGQPALLYRTNYLFMGTQVKAGEHVIEFNYVPVSFYKGLILSILSLIVVGLIYYLFDRLANKFNLMAI